MYEKRTYRTTSRPDDLLCYEVVYKETDLFCCTSANVRTHIEERVLFYRNQLDSYVAERPDFANSLVPVARDATAPKIVKEMISASARIGVGPMACVAGAVAEFVGRDINRFSEEYIIENGGDIYLRSQKERKIVVYAKDSPYSGKIGIRIKPSGRACGVCTSSATVGPSLSFGIADAVCVVSFSALFADGLATRLGNLVKKEDDIGTALEDAKGFEEAAGILIIVGKSLGVWGNIDLIEV
jgi:ApbE superfamily uncharacterized protein (UPF0280 family)